SGSAATAGWWSAPAPGWLASGGWRCATSDAATFIRPSSTSAAPSSASISFMPARGYETRSKSSPGLLRAVVSIDSAAWNGRFGHTIEDQRRSRLSQLRYAYQVALPRYLQRVQAVA